MSGSPVASRLTTRSWQTSTYEVKYGHPVLCVPALGIDSCIGGGAIVSATGTSTAIVMPEARSWSFRVRARSMAGCSAFSPYLTEGVPF